MSFKSLISKVSVSVLNSLMQEINYKRKEVLLSVGMDRLALNPPPLRYQETFAPEKVTFTIEMDDQLIVFEHIPAGFDTAVPVNLPIFGGVRALTFGLTSAVSTAIMGIESIIS